MILVYLGKLPGEVHLKPTSSHVSLWGQDCACWQRCGFQCAHAKAASLLHIPKSPEMLSSLLYQGIAEDGIHIFSLFSSIKGDHLACHQQKYPVFSEYRHNTLPLLKELSCSLAESHIPPLY